MTKNKTTNKNFSLARLLPAYVCLTYPNLLFHMKSCERYITAPVDIIAWLVFEGLKAALQNKTALFIRLRVQRKPLSSIVPYPESLGKERSAFPLEAFEVLNNWLRLPEDTLLRLRPMPLSSSLKQTCISKISQIQQVIFCTPCIVNRSMH